MKGVEAIIAIILILMIVVALAALAYTWFSGIFTGLTTSAQSSVDVTTTAMSTNYRIESAKNISGMSGTGINSCYNITVTVRNLGTVAINVSKWSAYINEENMKIVGSTITDNVPYGTIATFNVTNKSIPTFGDPVGKKLKIITDTGLVQTATIA